MSLPIVIFWLIVMQKGYGGVTIPYDTKQKCEIAAHELSARQPGQIDAYCVESSLDLPL